MLSIKGLSNDDVQVWGGSAAEHAGCGPASVSRTTLFRVRSRFPTAELLVLNAGSLVLTRHQRPRPSRRPAPPP